MGRFEGIRFGAVTIVVTLIVFAALLLKGGFFISNHEGDAIHVADIVLRMARGEVPHFDFHTPIGFLAFEPIVLFTGWGIGTAIFAGGLLVTLFLLPAIWWNARSRLGEGLGYVLFLVVLLMTAAAIFGGFFPGLALSMHYNRWAWAIAVIVLVNILVPPRDGQRTGRRDGLLIGLGMGALALMKMTFFVALFPGIVVVLLLNGAFRTIAVAFIAGLLMAVLATLWSGEPAFLLNYANDLLAVPSGGLRPYSTMPLSQMLVSPYHLLAFLTVLAAVVALSERFRAEAIGLLLLLPGFILISFQNWGNDPKWLVVVAIMLAALRKPVDLRPGLSGGQLPLVVLVAASVLVAPIFINLGQSIVRTLRVDAAEFTAPLAEPRGMDLFFQEKRVYKFLVSRYLPAPTLEMEEKAARFRDHADQTLWGQPLPYCTIENGYVGLMAGIAEDLVARKAIGREARVFYADPVSPLWLFGAGAPVPEGWPWYYGGEGGMKNATHVVVPICSTSLNVRGAILAELEKTRPAWRERLRTDHYILLERKEEGS